jgi:hypothetical protein
MLCPKCKAYNLDTDKFCAKCGTFMSPANKPVQPVTPKAEPIAVNPRQIPCSKCGTSNNDTDKFCLKCGTPLIVPIRPVAPPVPVAPRTDVAGTPCSKCGTINADSDKFCLKCGTPLTPQVKQPVPAATAAPIAAPAPKTEVPILEAAGIDANLELLPGKIRIKWNEKEITLSHIASIQLKEADETSSGYLKFTLSVPTSDGQSETGVTFSKTQQKAFESVKLSIEQAKADAAKALITSAGLNDLEKLADLKAKGIITEEEFKAKKKQILGI